MMAIMGQFYKRTIKDTWVWKEDEEGTYMLKFTYNSF